MNNCKVMVTLVSLLWLFSIACGQDVDWSDEKIETFETNSKYNIIYSLSNNDPFVAREIVLMPYQVSEINQRMEIHQTKQAQMLGRQNPKIAMARLLIAMKDSRGEKMLKEVVIEQQAFAEEFVDEIVRDILVPNQIKRLAQLTRGRRFIEQSKSEDYFEIPILLAKAAGIAKSEIANLEKIVAAERLRYHSLLEKKRKEVTNELIMQLDKSSRTKIDSFLGELYDMRSEQMEELKSAVKN